MSEKCPLGPGIYWDNAIPDVCRENCFDKWDGLSRKPSLYTDFFSDTCEASSDKCSHDVESNGEGLQRAADRNDSWRGYGLNYACTVTGEEQFAEDYEFYCDNNDPNFPSQHNPFVYPDSEEV
mgnify:CR=1 FL=1